MGASTSTPRAPFMVTAVSGTIQPRDEYYSQRYNNRRGNVARSTAQHNIIFTVPAQKISRADAQRLEGLELDFRNIDARGEGTGLFSIGGYAVEGSVKLHIYDQFWGLISGDFSFYAPGFGGFVDGVFYLVDQMVAKDHVKDAFERIHDHLRRTSGPAADVWTFGGFQGGCGENGGSARQVVKGVVYGSDTLVEAVVKGFVRRSR